MFGFDTAGALFTVSGNDLKFGGATFATIVNADGMLTITFTSAETPATTALVNDVLRHVTYTNTSDAPPGQVALAYVFSDGNSGDLQGERRSRKRTHHEDRRHRAGRRSDDLADDSATTNENSAAFIKVLDNDSDPDAPLVVRAINGTPIAVNGTVLVANGKVSLGGDGTLVYEPAFGFHDRRRSPIRPEPDCTISSSTGRRSRTISTASRRSRPRAASVARDGLRRRGAGAEPQRQHRQLRHPLHRRDQCRDRRQLTFYTTSDDGSALYIDGVLVVNNDFSQGATERSGTVDADGRHARDRDPLFRRRRRRGAAGPRVRTRYAGSKTALLDSALMTWAATVSVDVTPVNDPPCSSASALSSMHWSRPG